jgi:hypothetical protein
VKQDCIAALSIGLARAANWRAKLSEQYPDYRNARASKLLAKLASKASSLSDEQWLALDWKSDRWREAFEQSTRQVGFRFKKIGFAFFLRNLSGILSATASDGEPARAA